MTPKQQAFMDKLYDERDFGDRYLLEGQVARALENPRDCATREASRLIDALLALPRKQNQARKQLTGAPDRRPIPNVPAGCYALADPTRFYQVDRPERGKYAGWVFLAELTGDNHRPIKLREAAGEFYAVLEAIAADEIAAARRYGHLKRHCGYCKQRLTDPFSRFYGVGPVCRRAHGMPISAPAYQRLGAKEAAEWAAWLQADQGIDGNPYGAQEAAWDAAVQMQEREQEEAAFMAKMRRDEMLFAPETPPHLA